MPLSHYGYRKATTLLRDAGWLVNTKRAERIWRRAAEVIDVLSDLLILRGVPAHIRSDKGPEIVSKAVRGRRRRPASGPPSPSAHR